MLAEGVSLQGGWDGDFVVHDPALHPTAVIDVADFAGLDSTPVNAALLASGPISRATRVEDLRFRGAPNNFGRAALITSFASPTISRCILDGGGTAGGLGFRMEEGASPHLVDSEVRGAENSNGNGNSFVSVRAAGLVERSRIFGANSSFASRGLVIADSIDAYRDNIIVGGDTGSTSVAVDILAGGVVVFENNIVLGGTTARTSEGIIMQGDARVQMRHNLVISGPAASEESNALRMGSATFEREIVNNLFIGSSAANARCVEANQPIRLFANNAFSRCDTLWDFGGTLLTTIADVNAIADPGSGPPRLTVDNVAATASFVEEGVDFRLAADADAALREGGRDERGLVPFDAAGVRRTAPVSIGPFEAD